jgi:hypothetical protein
MSCNANAQTFHADLSGFQELGALNAETGAIFTPGTGTLDLKLDQKLQMLTYTLTYSGLNLSCVASPHSFRPNTCARGHFPVPLHEPRQWTGWQA